MPGSGRTPADVPSAPSGPLVVALLLAASGFCALAYEVAWLRMLRLVFGASTAASAAVVAIFLGGLGLGGWWFGRRADRVPNPLRLYADLELGVAVTGAATPLLVAAVSRLYVLLGGTSVLGPIGATALRLVLAALVLGLPAALMGGTLPAAVRAAEAAADESRRVTGLLYGVNTLGAFAGALYANFLALELFGTDLTVWSASLVNLALAFAARVAARRVGDTARAPAAPEAPGSHVSPASATLVLVAAAVVGFAFLLMELVWYRMLAPLLGGSSYTFGLILAVALLGIGTGALVYSAGRGAKRPTLVGFVTICVVEALCIAAPYALGDRIAILAAVLRPLGFLGFGPLVLVWLAVTVLVVLPPAVVAGYQFPLLVGLLGTGEREVGRQVGLAYASNTAGAIVGSLAGGFGLIPVLTAPGAWRAVVLLLVALAAVCLVQALRGGGTVRQSIVPLGVGLVSLLLCRADGPTAFWRHSAIGAGRFEASFKQPADLRRTLDDRRRRISWEADGVESAVALDSWDGYRFLINGKNDGNAIGDAPTPVMLGLVGAVRHAQPRTALVIGLGTGSTAGWLAQVSSIERVDVVELERSVVHVAEVCRPVNHDVLHDPKVHLVIGDGREFLLTTRTSYDLIVSEPSSPYRAGVASLFTREFYQAAAARLAEGGIFSQWVQAYEVDAPTVRTIYATLHQAFPVVDTWEVQPENLVLMGRRHAEPDDFKRLEDRLGAEPYRSALAFTWGVSGVEGLYSAFVGDDGLATALASGDGTPLNTDDRTVIEFAFARTVGRTGLFDPAELFVLADSRGSRRPPIVGGALDWNRVAELRTLRVLASGQSTSARVRDPGLQQRLLAREAYASGDLHGAATHWLAQELEPQGPIDVMMVAESLAAGADPRALPYIEQVRAFEPPAADALLARAKASAGELDAAAGYLATAFRDCRAFPWSYRPLLARSLELAWSVSQQRHDLGAGLFDALAEPFAVRSLEGQRVSTYVSIGLAIDFAGNCVRAFAALEPWVPWDGNVLEQRARCYALKAPQLAARAQADLAAFVAESPGTIDATGRAEAR
jgi:spermidine synthase